MNTRTQSPSRYWRWALIASQLIVITFSIMDRVLVVEAGHRAAFETVPSLIVGGLASISLLFLLFGSPFLVRSHGRLAIIGWCVGAAALAFSAKI